MCLSMPCVKMLMVVPLMWKKRKCVSKASVRGWDHQAPTKGHVPQELKCYLGNPHHPASPPPCPLTHVLSPKDFTFCPKEQVFSKDEEFYTQYKEGDKNQGKN